MRYIGSKSSSIEEIFHSVLPYRMAGTFCDPFGGTSTVGAYFKQKGFQVYTGDLLLFAHYIQIAKLAFNMLPLFEDIKTALGITDAMDIATNLNQIPGASGWLVENFAIQRQYFTLANAARIEACWQQIISFKDSGLISFQEYAFLMASLIESMDRVANTAGTYYAYLKKFSVKASREFRFEFITPVNGAFAGESDLGDALELIKRRHYDVIYLDPPYNDRRYHGYYHLPEALARGITPKVTGKAGVCRFDLDIPSDFYGASSALRSLENILSHADYNLLLFHYCPNGLIPQSKLDAVFQQYASTMRIEIQSLGYSTKRVERKSTTLLYMIKNEQRPA
jgi:adenine-specific DNA-methyltransferase